ncbi:hypothetical protein [Ketogulonicigenium vulgare]|uniref:hypothetical protein n=1 Tax=Ketogulonicigenium vulgare TaxID=92945 RepID=UPI002358ED61|nr:hypothetical protein [Ketogulonicigenium vulgare]
MFKYLATASAIAMATTAFAQEHDHDHDHHDEDVTLYRVFVGDHAGGSVTALDLADPDHRWQFDTTGQVKLFGVAGGATVAAVQSDDNAVHFFSSGISFEDHGDHADIAVSDPAAIDTVLTGPRPFHVVDHGGSVIINYDQGGYAELIDAHHLSHGEVELTTFTQSQAHHGFVARLGGNLLSTVASDVADAPRLGLQAFNADGTPAGDLVTCTAIHGEAFSGAYLAAGCREGVLTATASADGVTYNMLPYEADLPAGNTTGTLLGSTGIQVFLGNYGANGLVVVDPVDAPHFRYIELPFRRVDFALDPVHPANGYVLTEDGTLHQVNLLEAALTGSVKVTEPYSMDGHWNDARPRLAMAGDEVIITDPNAGLLRRIDTDTLRETGTIAVEGAPYNIAVVGGSGIDH